MADFDGLTWVSALWRRGCLGKLLAVVLSVIFAVSAVVVGAVAVSALRGDGEPVVDVPTPVAVTLVTATPEPVTLAGRVGLALGESNRGIVQRMEVDTMLDVITVRWAINENISTAATVTGAWMDVARMLGAIHAAGGGYSLINFEGTFALSGGEESPVFWVSFDRATVEAVNWLDTAWVDGVLYQRLPDMAASVKMHPILQEE